ncbi:MAG: hypothetical protein CL912_01875 [Deltaproteobacteria bacterium]|nr:hypothetical protein [Deltaproteobacteria bacterium]
MGSPDADMVLGDTGCELRSQSPDVWAGWSEVYTLSPRLCFLMWIPKSDIIISFFLSQEIRGSIKNEAPSGGLLAKPAPTSRRLYIFHSIFATCFLVYPSTFLLEDSSSTINKDAWTSVLGMLFTYPAFYPSTISTQLTDNVQQILPLVAGVFWSGMLATFMIYWQTTGQPHYSSMDSAQNIPYISDIGAFRLKPLFITGAAVTTICVDLSLISERWLRHRGQLARNFTHTEKGLSIASIVCGVIGGLGLLFLSIFDTADYGTVHNIGLFVFMAGYIASATCSCWEYQSLGSRKFPPLG